MVIALDRKILGGIFLTAALISILFIWIYHHASEVGAFPSKDNTVCLPIIMYHQVKTNKTGKDAITPNEFESDLKYLSENHYTTITMNQLVDFVYNNKELPEKPIILSFDDGYLNNYEYVFPLIKRYNVKIVLSIVGKSTDDFTKIEDINLNYSHVTWDQLREMIHSGYVEVQNHTYNMHQFKERVGCMQKKSESLADYEQALMNDIGKLQEEIKTMTGKTPNTFAYPYGRYNENTNIILRKMGFKATLSCKFGVNIITRDPNSLYDLKRICRAHRQSVKKLLKKGMNTVI